MSEVVDPRDYGVALTPLGGPVGPEALWLAPDGQRVVTTVATRP